VDKDGRCVRLTTYHHPVLLSRNLGTLTSWNPLGHSRPATGLIYLYIFLSHRVKEERTMQHTSNEGRLTGLVTFGFLKLVI